jgi:hypothetical protein
VGDIIFAEYSGGRIAMVYVGNGQLVVADSISGTCTLQTITGDEFSSDNILVTLLAYDRYAFLCPAMV